MESHRNILRELIKLKLHLIFFIVGPLLILLGYYKSLGEEWFPIVRENPIILLIFIGVIILIISVILFFFSKRIDTFPEKIKKGESMLLNMSDNEVDKLTDVLIPGR